MEDFIRVPLLLSTLMEPFLLVGCELYFYDAFNAVLADNYWNTEADVVLAVLTVLGNAAGDDSLLVVQDGADDACCAGAGCVVC